MSSPGLSSSLRFGFPVSRCHILLQSFTVGFYLHFLSYSLASHYNSLHHTSLIHRSVFLTLRYRSSKCHRACLGVLQSRYWEFPSHLNINLSWNHQTARENFTVNKPRLAVRHDWTSCLYIKQSDRKKKGKPEEDVLQAENKWWNNTQIKVCFQSKSRPVPSTEEVVLYLADTVLYIQSTEDIFITEEHFR